MTSIHQLTLDSGSGSLAAEMGLALASSSSSSKLATNESCGFLAAVPPAFPGCRYPRSCSSCLQKDSCMIDPSGMCSDPLTNGFDARRHYLYASSTQLQSATKQRWYFPANVVDYCAEDDALCRNCRANNFWLGDRTPDSRFCVGGGGCVCVANCYEPDVTNADGTVLLICSDQFELPVGPMAERNVGFVVQLLATGVATLVVCACILMWRLSRAKRNRRAREVELLRLRQEARLAYLEQRRRQRATELGVGDLSLAGWLKYRQDLLSKGELMISSQLDSVDHTLREDDRQYVAIADEVSTERERDDRAGRR